jgi:hypothetical protein
MPFTSVTMYEKTTGHSYIKFITEEYLQIYRNITANYKLIYKTNKHIISIKL